MSDQKPPPIEPIPTPVGGWVPFLREWADLLTDADAPTGAAIALGAAAEIERLEALAGPQWDVTPPTTTA